MSRTSVSTTEVSEPAPAEAEQSRIQAWFSRRSAWSRRGLAVLAGALATLGHAPFQIVPAFIIAIVVLVWLLDAAHVRPRPIVSAFGAGWWFGLGHFATGLYWIASAFLVDSQAYGFIYGVPAVAAMAGGLALFWGAGCALAMALWTRDMRRVPAFAFALMVSELARGYAFGGFPWLLPGYIWMPGEPVSQFAAIFSIYGLSAITLLIAAAPATIADGQTRAGVRFAPLIAAAAFTGLIWGWGAQRIAGAPIELPGEAPIVRVADAGLGQAEKWRARPDQEYRVLARYIEASGPPDDSRASILIWPEGAIPTINFFLLRDQRFLDALGRGLGDRALVTGLSRCEPVERCDAYMRGEIGSEGLRFFNSAAVIDGVAGRARVDLTQVYDKHRLVPFGEFIPLWSLVSRFNIAPLQRIGAGFEAGDPPTRLVVPEAPPAIVLICYEAIFPFMIPQGAERPGWIISVTNDAWFGNGTGPWQHYVAARYRAIEEGLPMARAASGGISAIIDSYGRAVVSSAARGGAVEAQLPPSLPRENSPVFWRIILFAALLASIAGLRCIPPKKWREVQ